MIHNYLVIRISSIYWRVASFLWTKDYPYNADEILHHTYGGFVTLTWCHTDKEAKQEILDLITADLLNEGMEIGVHWSLISA